MKISDKSLVIIAIVGGGLALAVFIGFIGQGNVRHVQIFYPEKVEQTIAFKEIDGKVKIIGISGTSADNNPILIMRTSFAYVLTVVNEGEKHHRLYIDGFDIQTNLLAPGEKDTIILYPQEEGVYSYYDKRQDLERLGELRSVAVVPSDQFTGFLKDMI